MARRLMRERERSNAAIFSGIAILSALAGVLFVSNSSNLQDANAVMMDNKSGMMMDNKSGMMMDNKSGMMMDNKTT
jgi:hypothetical protein